MRQSFDQSAAPVFGVNAWSREADDLARLDVDLVDVRAAERRLAVLAGPLETVNVRIIDPFAVEGDERIGDGAVVAARDQHFLAAVGMQQHQVGARVHQGRMGDLGPAGCGLSSPLRGART